MLISKLQKAPSLLYTLSCGHESWLSTAKYLIEDVPLLLKSEEINNVQEALSAIFSSLPSVADDFIKWVAEVRRQDEGGATLSKEEKARLSVKEEVLQQVHETELFKTVTKLITSGSPCCKGISSLNGKDNLPEIAMSVCCQGATLLIGKLDAAKGFCCKLTCVKCLKANGDTPKTVVSGTIVTGGSEEAVDILVPLFQRNPESCCCSGVNSVGMHPASNDVLTVLLLALPPYTWSGIKDEKLLAEIQSLVSTENLPIILQEEVLNLRQQLYFLKRCQEKKLDDDLSLPLMSSGSP